MFNRRSQRYFTTSLLFATCLLATHTSFATAQDADAAKVELGSKTAKGGFRNEDEIRDKFNHWETDSNAKAWLKAMNYRIADIVDVKASKPHGYKADVEVSIQTKNRTTTERISIKLVSSPNGVMYKRINFARFFRI